MATYFDSGQQHFGVFVERQRLFWFVVGVLGTAGMRKKKIKIAEKIDEIR